uniref:ATP dependent DNA helicase n=1 Tax=Siphoviridae sp. ctBCr48 TaxID=2827802 RepID=A0A8S5SGY6_9CAUD|nr:MAG TPA: ATP dependent DNA helicase [Siphoviridae sp. ctBCr48]
MSLNVKCKCNKEVYNKGGFKVYGFFPTGGDPIDVNKYGGFSISGEQTFDVGQEYYLSLSPIENSKYPCSYNFDGFVGIGFVGEEIKVDPKEQVRILSMYMEESQAKACTEGYPNFLELILTNRENEINLKKIHGVGNKLLAKYCDKIRGDCKSVLFVGILGEYGATDSRAYVKASISYSSPTKLREALNDDPYGVLCSLCERKTKAVDRMLEKQHPELLSTKSRCVSAVNDLLDEMESEGSTRCNAKVLVDLVKEEYPECIKWISECVAENDKVFFDSESKYVSKMSTFEAECKIARELKARAQNPIVYGGDIEQFRQIGDTTMTDEQMGALNMVKSYSTGTLCGCAGTGKSSSVNAIVKYLESINKTYVLLAPTGCAAKRLTETTGRKASTIHMWMVGGGTCAADVVLIDEFSMVGIDLFSMVLGHVSDETKVLMVCDPSQLASISCGNLAQDIIDSGIVPVTRLTKVFRYNSSGIATIVTDTRNGVPSSIESEQFDDYTFEEQASATPDVLDQIKEAYAHYLDKGYGMKDILCLCPYNKGALGTRIINAMLQQEFNDHEFTGVGYETQYETVNFKIGDKVINKRNNYNAQIYDPDYVPKYDEFGNFIPNTTFIANGDIGTVVDVQEDELGEMSLIVAFDEATIVFDEDEIKHLRLAYAISVHSSQGSESPVVIALMLRQHLYMINRNIEYVAFSRAKTELCIIGDTRTIANGMKEVQNLERDTWLKELLTENS